VCLPACRPIDAFPAGRSSFRAICSLEFVGRSSRADASGQFEPKRNGGCKNFILWLIAVILVVLGIGALLRRQIIWGVVLIVVGLLVGPGGVSIIA
jgi:hypothetical protein